MIELLLVMFLAKMCFLKKLPLSLLRAAKGQPLLVELKNGETYNGTLVACDNYMNLSLSGVVCTSRDADKFWQIESIYIRGITIKYLRVPQETMALVKEDTGTKDETKGRGRGRGRGRGQDDKRTGGGEKRGRGRG
jgi:U6 snRNA-associated Sm-like protein LSm4